MPPWTVSSGCASIKSGANAKERCNERLVSAYAPLRARERERLRRLDAILGRSRAEVIEHLGA